MWVQNVATGKSMPVSAIDVARPHLKPGMVVVARDGENGRVLTKSAIADVGEVRTRIDDAITEGRVCLAHFADGCPQAEQWRGRTRTQGPRR